MRMPGKIAAAKQPIAAMASLTIYDRTGSQVGTYEIEPTDLVPRINKQLLHDAVVMYEANLRQGTFGTQEPGASGRFHEEDVSPEGHRQRPGRFAPQRYSSWRRSHFRQAAARFRLPPAAQGLADWPRGWPWRRRSRRTNHDDRRLETVGARKRATWRRSSKAVKCDEASTLLVATAAARRQRLQIGPQY